MKAMMLAAGIGNRLARGPEAAPKVLLRFGEQSLLERHIEILRHFGVSELIMGVGYRSDEIRHEIHALGAEDFVRLIENPDYTDGAIRTLWCLAPEFTGDDDAILMDADVLYDHRMMAKLIRSEHANCFLMDRKIDPGEDPVKLCVKDGYLVDFHKQPQAAHDWRGEWIGFMRFSPEMARRLPEAVHPYIAAAQYDVIYEQTIRDLLVASPPGTFHFEDITGLPWVEIDFPEDLDRAEHETFEALEDLPE
ncbi:MAG: phosphocholine cytidylyltransferase family protein [Alphaproteobacteria bacterium]|jgi:choline kinase|nr:phosphocholine cytidylyltransferase family protein [Alphaproteobacteria bacterium]